MKAHRPSSQSMSRRARPRASWLPSSWSGWPRHPSGQGYNLVILVMMITILNIMVAAALPAWSGILRRHKEAELIFRGLQYAEAIRVFQTRFNRPPTRLQELLETKPRSIRQLWDNPMSDDGSWGLIMASSPQPGQGQGQGQGQGAGDGQRQPLVIPGASPQAPVDQQPPRRGRGAGAGDPEGGVGGGAVPRGGGRNADGQENQTTTGPIQGVFSPEGDTAMRTFLDSKEIAQWRFTVDLVSGTAGGAVLPDTNQPVPLNSDHIGRPWPPGVVPPALQQQGGKGGAPAPGDHPQGPGQQQPPRPRRR